MRVLTSIIVAALLCHFPSAWAADEGTSAETGSSDAASEETAAIRERPRLAIETGVRVSIDYVLTTDDGTVVDDNDGDLLVYDHGDSPLLPQVEEGLVGLSRGDTVRITIEPEDAFGPVDPDKISAVSIDLVPEFARTAGSEIPWTFPSGMSHTVDVIEVKESEIVIDFNHPLAGERLNFDIKVVAVRAIPE